jgi:hypothetical protein
MECQGVVRIQRHCSVDLLGTQQSADGLQTAGNVLIRYDRYCIIQRFVVHTRSHRKQTQWLLVRKRTIPTERPQLVGEI